MLEEEEADGRGTSRRVSGGEDIPDGAPFPVVGLFRDFLLKQALLAIQVGDKVAALRHDAAVLKDRRQTVKNAVEAQERGTSKKCTAEVQGWLGRAEEILHDSQEIEVGYQNRNCMLGTWCSLNCCSNYSISLRAVDVRQRANDALDFIAKVTDFVAETAPPSVQETNASVAPASASGQLKAMHEKALSFILKDAQGTLGIWGMGGVGKTTLLHLINNSMMSDGFTVIFVVASSGCTEEKLRELVAENQGLSPKGDLKKTIFDFLKEKDFVLLVDDLWDRLDLEDVGVPLPLGACNGRRRRKLILTTRSLQVCGEMGAGDNVIKLECLKREEAWALFQKNVGEGLLRSNPELEDLAKEVAGECEGHPLALITVGQALAQTADVTVWEDALKKLSMSRMHEIIDHSGHGGGTTTSRNKDPILLLKVSYDYLHPPSLKDCFLHCALWPEDHLINKNDLVECWMGHGLLSNGQLDDIADVYKEGQVIVDKLLKACLLENVEESLKTGSRPKNSRVKMHDLNRDMALWVARGCGADKKKWQVLTDHGKEEASEEAHKISIMHTKTKVLTTTTTCGIRKWPNLTTLILRDTSSLKDEDVTNIQYCSLLKYLDLSDNSQICSFPVELCKLDKLEHLNFSRTEICTLPEEAKGLVNLKLLLFRGARIRSIPYGVLANMSRLLVLDISVPYHPEPADQSEIIDGLDRMSGPPKALGINVSTESGLRKLAGLSGASMTSLNVHTMENSTAIHLLSEDFLGKPHMHSDLRILSISNCKGLEHLVLQTRCRLGTEGLYLHNLTVLKEIIWRNVQPRDVLPKLRYVDIRCCKILSHVSWVAQLPCLEHLTVYSCASLRRIVGEQVAPEPAAFRCLRSLKLVALQNLESICDQESVFPSLERLDVIYCSKLKKLPFGSPASSPKLQKITGSDRWWRGLVMEETLRASLRPLHYKLEAFQERLLTWHTESVCDVF